MRSKPQRWMSWRLAVIDTNIRIFNTKKKGFKEEMNTGKKITKEDTWRPDDLIKHIRSPEEESSRRRERSHRDPERERRKQREESGRTGGETRDERQRESRRERERETGDRGDTEKERQRDRYKDREKEKERDRLRERERDRDRDGLRERAKERDGEKEKEKEKRNREKERERNKERDREKEREREKRDREKDGEREKKDREREKRDWEKDREREKRDREKDREREKRDREKDREREKKDREKDGEREKRDRGKERDRLKEKERDRVREVVRDRGEERDREKDRERERRRAERENERRKEKVVHLDVEEQSVEREKDRKERHREREHRRGGEEHGRERREQERREKPSHRQNTGQTDTEERRERRRREKEQHVQFNHDGDRAREKEERDKGREKRQDDSSQRRKEHESVQKKTLQEVERDVTEDYPEEVEDYGNEDYEDDFEKMDYEEDFEEFDEDKEEEGEEEEEEEEEREEEQREVKRELSPRSRREVEAIQRAMEKENELLSPALSTQEPEISITASADSESRLRNSRTYSRVIDFTGARQREINQQASDKQKKRSSELLRLIDLDFSVTECLLDLPPVREYELYIRRYGMANTKQAYVQCNEDAMERDAQTEETEVTDMWTQHPPESSAACGGPRASQNASDEIVTRTTADSKRLAAFLRSATQVMAVLLEENIAESNSVRKLQSQTHTHSFSDGCVQLNTKLNILQGRQLTLLHFSQSQTHTLLSVHAPHSGSIDSTLDSQTLICVWNIWEPSTPQRILVYEAEVRSCCFSPGKATLVFAGTDVGSVLVWDLREHSGSHTHTRVCEEEWTLRHPTFSTDAVLSGAGHFSPVVSVEPVLVSMGAGLRDPLLLDQEESLGLSFQLGSLDENGLLNLWVVVELPRADDSGSQTDLGLRPGGKVKLLHSSSLQTTPRVDKGVLGVTSHLSYILKFLPSDSNHYFIGGNLGLVRHGTRNGLQAVPKLYRPKGGEKPAEVTALEFCPSGEPFFLVGCSDGSVRLHALACDEAVCEWTVGSGHGSVQHLQFSPTRCSVFCALDSTSVLHIWDLTQRDESPVITQDLHTDPVSSMAVFGEAPKQNPYSGIALAKHSGRLEVHFLLPSLTLPQALDTEKLHSLTRDTL